MDFLSGLSDDQKALFGCFVAFILCGALMSLSVYFRRDSGKTQQNDDVAAERPAGQTAHSRHDDSHGARRKAA